MMFIKFYTIFIFFILCFWIIGWGAKKLLRINETISYYSVSFNIFIGLLAFSTITAIIATKGKTVMIFSILFGVLSYILYRKDKEKFNDNHTHTYKPNNLKYILINLFLGVTAIYTIFFFMYPKYSLVQLYSTDYSFYATLSYNILHTGIEHCYTNYPFPPKGLQSYHYMEIWLNVGIATLTGQNYLYTLLYVVYPIFISIFYITLCTLLVSLAFDEKYIGIIGFLSTFMTGFFVESIPLYKYIFQRFQVILFINTPWYYHKISIIYVFLGLSIVLFVRRRVKYAYLVLMFLPIFYITSGPSIFASIGVIAIYLVISKQEEGIWLLVHVILVTTILFLFYFVFQDKEISINPKPILIKLHTIINIIGSTVIGIFSVYWHILLIIFVFLIKPVKQLLVSIPHIWLIFLIPFWGLIAWITFIYTSIDSIQLFSNMVSCILNLTSIGILFLLYKHKNKKVFYTYFILLILVGLYPILSMLYQNNSVNYEQKQKKMYMIQKILEKKQNKLGVFFRDTSDFPRTIFYFNDYSNFFDLTYAFHDTYNVLLNAHEGIKYYTYDQRVYKLAEGMINRSIFNRFMQKQKRDGRFVSIAQSQVDFIKEYKVTYLITLPGYKLPEKISPLIKNKVELGDCVLYLLE